MKTLTLLRLSFPSSCLWFLLVSSLCSICFCNQNSDSILCIPTERLALIDLKNNLTDKENRLSSWVGADCCRWPGVVCDNVTGHVHEIHLRGPDDKPHDTEDERGGPRKQTLGGTISRSVIKLLKLRHLDLSCNDFGLSLIPAFIGSFQNGRYLNLSYSRFSGEIPHQLGNLSTLRVLDLHGEPYDDLLYSKSLAWLKNLKGLQYLDMGGTNLTKASDWFQVVSNLTSLSELHFSRCGLYQLPSNLTTGSFTSLIALDLSYNNFDGMLPRWIFILRNLAYLDLSLCNFSGVNPGTRGGFHSMPSLRTLRVSSNTFMNSSSLLNGLSSLSKLRLLDVSYCGISLPILGKLQNLSSIEYVDLTSNGIVEKIPKSLSNLCNIRNLDLRYNNLFGNVSELLERFGECESPKLEALDFSGNYLIGKLPERLGKLKNLIEIDVSSNQLTGTIPDSLGSLSLLQTLWFSNNQFSGSIPRTIGGLSSLLVLDFSYNKLNGTIPDSVGNLSQLQKIYLNSNQLSGWIPNTIGGLSWLGYLDLSYNMLNGSLPESIGRLGKLNSLILQHNSLTGILTENHFANLTDLLYLLIGDNKLVFGLNVNWIPPFKLIVLRASSCSLGPQFPSWIQSQDLSELDVANTNISDAIPNWFWNTVSRVTYLNISHNNIEGMLGNVTFLAYQAMLDLSNNRLHGTLPGNFSTAEFLDISNNNLSGSLEQFLCSSVQEPPPQLQFLNLANNYMSGVISDCWMNFPYLSILNLENNQFSGIIPSSLGNISSLQSLEMDDNRLSDNLPPWLLNSTSLVVIELANNELMGKIPSSIGRNNTSLRVLSLRSNKLEGKIPDEICHLSSLQILDLAHNDHSGNLPKCFTNFSVISGREPSSPIVLLFIQDITPIISLVTKGNTYTYSTILYQVTSFDLSDNKFSGSIPDELVGLLGLRFLNLSHNNLTGTIPNLFNQSGKLESLDLSMNRLEGNIPLSLSQLTALNWLNVSYNNLVGTIPTGPQLQTFNESCFTGNSLCGLPLPPCLQNNGDTEGTTNKDDEADGMDWILVILTLVGFIVGFWSIIAPLFLIRRWRIAYYHFLEENWFKIQIFILLQFLRLTRRSRSI